MDCPQAIPLPLGDALESVDVDVGFPHRLRGPRQDPRDIQRHVALADHRSRRSRRWKLQAGVVRVAIVPFDQGRGPDNTGELLARKAQRPIARRAGADDDGVVALPQQCQRQPLADLDVAKEAEPVVLRHIREVRNDVLHLGMVRRHAEADKAERRRQPLEHVDLHGPLYLALVGQLEQVLRRVERRRARADDRDMVVAPAPEPRRRRNTRRGCGAARDGGAPGPTACREPAAT
mmetsp:Transcript_122251/g.342186  ORF Transcript_122251/g.342186 Transcript_122251/m.342186 type:complete len:234 (-) Transcript_122251:40-741(-)